MPLIDQRYINLVGVFGGNYAVDRRVDFTPVRVGNPEHRVGQCSRWHFDNAFAAAAVISKS